MIQYESFDLCVKIGGVENVVRKNTIHRRDFSSMECVAFQGVLLSRSRLVGSGENQIPPDLTVEEALHSNGEWLAVFQDTLSKDEYLVLTDSFAFQTAFYAVLDGKNGHSLVVATTPQAVAYERNSEEIGLNPDWAHMATVLATHDSWSSTINSDRTADLGVATMRPFEMMYVRHGEATICSRADYASVKEKSYEDLLRSGIEAAIDQLVVLGKQEFSHRRINLSGGRDSRLMMGLLGASGMTNNYDVRSVNPNTWADRNARLGLEKDLLLADTMRRRYGMSWAREPDYVVDSVKPFEVLANWQALQSSLNYRFSMQREWFKRDPIFAELRGASGETFRAFWSHYWRRHPSHGSLIDSEGSLHDDAMLLFRDIFRSNLVSPDLIEPMQTAFTNSLEVTGRSTIREAGDRHFTLFRNRGHFGTTLRFLQDGALPIFPLNQAAFVAAGELLARNDRVDGAVFFDLLEMLDPALNDLEFDSDQWPERIRSRRRVAGDYSWDVSKTQNDVPEYFDNESANGSLFADGRRRNRRPKMVFNDDAFATLQIRELVDELKLLPNSELLFTRPMESWLMTTADFSVTYANHQVSKLHSFRDLVVGSKATSTVRLGQRKHSPLQSLAYMSRLDNGVPAGFRRSNETLLYRVRITRREDQIVGEILVDNTDAFDLEFAFYLRHGEKVLQQKMPYQLSRFAHFTQPKDGRKFHLQGFVRRAGQPLKVRILRSVEIE